MVVRADMQIGAAKSCKPTPCLLGMTLTSKSLHCSSLRLRSTADICHRPTAGARSNTVKASSGFVLFHPSLKGAHVVHSAGKPQLLILGDIPAGQAPDHQTHAVPPASSGNCGPRLR